MAKAESWLLEPAAGEEPAALPPSPRPVVAVRGLSAGCGCSTVARALAAVLAVRDPSGAAALGGGVEGVRPRLAAPASARLARELARVGVGTVRASGRICLLPADLAIEVVALERPCPVVIDVASGAPPAEGLAQADHTVLVTTASDEPALAAAVEASLVLAGHHVDVVVNRAEEPDRTLAWGPGSIAIGESRLAAQVALAFRGARGPLAEPVGELADRCRASAPG
jgi:hypothetical protein